MTLSISTIGPRIVHFHGDASVVNKTFCRMQEYYESPDPSIKGKVFTLGQLKKSVSKFPGYTTYSNQYCPTAISSAVWGGFNFPDYIIDAFLSGSFDPLSEEEQGVLEIVKYIPKPYYVIGTTGLEYLPHEVSHALFYLQPSYRAAGVRLLHKYKNIAKALKRFVVSKGYSKDLYVLCDEALAYGIADGAERLLYNDLENITTGQFVRFYQEGVRLYTNAFRKEVG